MAIIKYGEPLNVLVAVKGHPYQRDAFHAVFEEMDGVAATFVEQPAAASLMSLAGMAPYDCLVLYDMPGIDFRAKGGAAFVPPTEEFKAGLVRLLESGKGILALHHAIAGWPAWEAYGEFLGGRFLYRPGQIRGKPCNDSGYRHDVSHQAQCIGDHPVLAGLPRKFELTDELYLYEVFEEDVTPLLRSRHAFERDGFYSAAAAIEGRMFSNEGWAHASGSNLIGWVKRAGRSPLVYLQPGDGPATYADPNYRRLIRNAVTWLASEEARAFGRGSA